VSISTKRSPPKYALISPAERPWKGPLPADQARIGEVWKDHTSGTATRVTSAMTLLHVRHDLLAEEQLTHSLLCPALSDDVIGHGDEITTSALER